jgi:hypothetical protein
MYRLKPLLNLHLNLSCWSLLLIMLAAIPMWGHQVKTDDQVGATIHFEPVDQPKAQEPTLVWFALTKKGGQVIPLKDCQCQLQIKQLPGNQKLNTPKLQVINAEKYQDIPSATVLFPQPGAYALELTGQPVKTGDFRPFQLEFATTVTAGIISATSPEANLASNTDQKSAKCQNCQNDLLVAIFGTIGIMAGGIGGWIFLHKWLRG